MRARANPIAVSLLAGLLLAACDGVESTPGDAMAPLAANDLGSRASVDAGALAMDAAVAHGVFFSFGIAAPDDPPKKKDLLLDQVHRVAEVIGKMKNPSFDSSVLLGAPAVSPDSVKARLEGYAQTLGSGDTFVMYSHSHGTKKGLLLGFEPGAGLLSWEDLAELILALPAKNVLVFTMSCHSGALADLLKSSEYAARWQGRTADDRSLVVMTAVAADETAAATDFLIGNPNSIGNPFNYAVRTALAGQADGFSTASGTGAADGVTTLSEARGYILQTGKEKAKNDQQNPQFAGELVDDERFPTAP
jgi:hypothetical protein